jgi:hypothetical protein
MSASTPKRINVHELFEAQQGTLLATLIGNRKLSMHPETKGTASELHWQAMLAQFLPTRYFVSKASVIDADGCASDQFDAVIHDRHFSPMWMAEGASLFIPAESVYGVVEVKQDLSRKHVKYAIEKAASVRKLRRTTEDVPLVEGRQPGHILAAIVCLESTWKKDPFGAKLVEALSLADEYGRLDLGCALRHGSFEISYGAGSPSLRVSEPATALSFFCLRLFARLRELGSVAPLRVDDWSSFL